MWVSLFVILCMSVITQDGDSALMRAAYYGYTDIAAELVKAKANLDLQNNVRTTSHDVHVHYCIIHVHEHVVTVLYGHYFAVYMFNDNM